MKLIKPSFDILEQDPGLQGIYEAIERAGRTCYKSKRPEGQTAKDFVDRMIKSGHNSMLEHGTVYLDIPLNIWGGSGKYLDNPYSMIKIYQGHIYVSSNYRVLVENDWLDDLKYLCKPTEFHERRVTVRFTSNIHFYKDLTRHRTMSYAIESTRYCNYSKDKFGNELTFILPAWVNKEMTQQEAAQYTLFRGGLECAEITYLGLIKEGWKAQQAAEILPQATKADIVCTGFVSDWEYIFKLRTSIIAATGKPHPEVSRLMDPLYKEFCKREYIK